ncbi:MmcQ/YjbR family DNA-binding protein [Rhizorhabdus wittichii]|uniref:MmcQ/YjbR family DNA-binding protein n=1 Tax=Rhizorhabdus wittichii TaxID=160791 RepID=A0A975HEC2_9SPHN|nr:MmcQ/YjbR family DNA-binding protein [Rhizorhabdus wittichii]QTH22321.1 MmcQ/YjbR family DNA-binding protein [Rhizorhabdus wittichii]
MASDDPRAVHARVAALAAALPQVEEKVSHGSPCWRVADKRMFAYFWHNHHGDDRTALLVKTSGVEEQEMLIDLDPDIYFKPPYLGPSGWIGVRLDQPDTDWEQVDHRLRESWRLAAPPKLAAMMEF